MEKFKAYFQAQNITKVEAAKQIGITRQTLYNVFKGNGIDYRTALKIQTWTGGKVSAVELMGM